MLRFVAFVLAATTAPVVLAQASIESVFKQLPDKAAMVVVIPSPEQLAGGLAAFGKAVGADEMGEMTVSEMLEEMEIPAPGTVDTAGPAAFAITADNTEGVLICTLKDGAKWKTESAAKDGEGGLLMVEEVGDYSFALAGNVLIMSPSAELAKLALKGSDGFAAKLKAAGPALDKNQAVLWIDTVALQPMIREGMASMEPMIMMGMSMAGPQAQSMGGMVKWMLEQVRTVTSEAQTVAIAARINADGVHLSKNVAFKDDGSIGGYLKSVKKPGKDLLRGVPDGRYPFALGFEWESSGESSKLMEGFINAMFEGLKTADAAGADEIKAKLDKGLEMFRKTTGGVGVLAQAADKKMVASNIYFAAEAAGMMDAFASYVEITPKLMGMVAPGVKIDIKSTTDRVGEAEARILEFTMSGENPQMLQQLEAMYGNPMTIAAAASQNGLAMTTGGGAAAREALAALLAGGGPFSGNAQVQAAMKTVAEKPQVVMLLDLPKLMALGIGMAGSMGAPMPPIAMPDKAVPLIIGAGYLNPTEIAWELDVPTAAIRPVVDAFRAGTEPPKGDEQ